ncbi:MAG: putative Integral membrane protein [Promethearchaeota archaeon]|nr:MAG: putative Integral membrane protein [Candidatus Lokiarchaeota archaeon]
MGGLNRMITIELILMVFFISFIGVTIAIIVSLIPGLHIYSILGFIVLILLEISFEELLFSVFVISTLIGYCLGSSISATYFQTPDDSSIFMVFPSQKYMEEGRGYEAVYLSGLGAIGGTLTASLLVIFLGNYLIILVDLLVAHSFWIIATAMVFVWMSEWPKDPARQKTRLGKLAGSWLQLLMGLFVIITSGILGIYLFFGSLVPPERSFQGLAAAFVGLFAFPSLLQNLVTGKKDLPKQNIAKSIEFGRTELIQGIGGGLIGGALGMLIPSVTAGIGNTFSRHAVAQSGDKSFMFSQGFSRAIYYIGAVLLLFIPGTAIRRGGAALFITLFYVPETQADLLITASAALIAAFVGWLLFILITKGVTKIIHRINTRYISLFGAVVMLILTYIMLGWSGLVILAVSTGIGVITIVFNTRRIHCIGVITIPMMISMGGLTMGAMSLFGIA